LTNFLHDTCEAPVRVSKGRIFRPSTDHGVL
jgi:hypothetical protein